ncbi:MAG: glycerol-3-phosphate 1-O-acyltransferase PlsY [Clostridia bacterium]|nr:glycerol-3-phosphate 1-O-acyltransferase PlsY [Clostridia bacterium]MBO5786277.1 glycerol-3-phosphate 1-O-acyltransferase PlsY [Clostridia bacterium]
MVYLYNVLPQMFGLMTKWAASVENATASNVIFVFAWVLCGVSAYLLGSLNSAIIVSTYKYKQDIRNFGSGNAGLTNMHRVYGKDGALLTLAGDIGKQVVSVLIGVILLGQTGAYFAGAFCMIGHIFPVFYKFKGGKGVLTAATMILLIDPMEFAVLFCLFALVLLLTRYVSLSSIIAALTYPATHKIATEFRTGHAPQAFELFFTLFVGLLVIYMHRSNIFRIFNNQESKFSFRKKPEAQEILDMEDKENDSDNTYYPPATNKGKKKRK